MRHLGHSKLARATATLIQYGGPAGVFQYEWEVLIPTKTFVLYFTIALVPIPNAVKNLSGLKST